MVAYLLNLVVSLPWLWFFLISSVSGLFRSGRQFLGRSLSLCISVKHTRMNQLDKWVQVEHWYQMANYFMRNILILPFLPTSTVHTENKQQHLADLPMEFYLCGWNWRPYKAISQCRWPGVDKPCQFLSVCACMCVFVCMECWSRPIPVSMRDRNAIECARMFVRVLENHCSFRSMALPLVRQQINLEWFSSVGPIYL